MLNKLIISTMIILCLSLGQLYSAHAFSSCKEEREATFRSWTSGSSVTITGTVKEIVLKNIELDTIPGRGFRVAFENDCGYYAAEATGPVRCKTGQKIKVRGVVIEMDIGIFIRTQELHCY